MRPKNRSMGNDFGDPIDAPELFEDEPDWHGLKAKRKRDGSQRQSMFVPVLFGVLIVAVLGLCGAVAFLTIKINNVNGMPLTPLIITQIVYSPEHLTEVAGPTLTQHASEVQTQAPPLRATSSTSVPVTASFAVDHLYEFDANNNPLRQVALPAAPEYYFHGLRVGPDGNLYAGQISIHGSSCSHNDAYWVIGMDGLRKSVIHDPKMISPLRIAFDHQGNRYIVGLTPDGTSCERFLYALFKFDPSGQLVDIFPEQTITIFDVAVTDSNRIFISIGDFAGGGTHNHLIELASDPESGKFKEVGEYFEDPSTVISYPTLLAVPRQEALYVIYQGSFINAIQCADRNRNVTIERIALSDLGPIARLQPIKTLPIDTLDVMTNGDLIGYDRECANVQRIVLNDPTALTSFHIPYRFASTFAYNPATGGWFTNGQ